MGQLRELRELQVEGHSFSYADLAHLPPSLTSLDLTILRRAHDEINVKVALGRSMARLANLRQFRTHGYGNDWTGLLAPLARMSGLADLEISEYCRNTLSSFRGLGNLTQLSMSCGLTGQGFAGLGPISDLSGLKELRLVGGTKYHQFRNPASLASVSSLSLLTNLTLIGFLAEDISWLTCPTLLAGLKSVGVQHCSFPMLQCVSMLAVATTLRSLDLCGQKQMIGPHLNVITSSQQLTYLDVSQISGLENQHLCFLSELQSLAELKMGHNPSLEKSVLPLLHPLSSLRSLDVSDSSWFGDGGLRHIAGILGLSHLKMAQCRAITVAGITEMVSCSCGALIRIMLGQKLSSMPSYHAYVERRLHSPVGAYCLTAFRPGGHEKGDSLVRFLCQGSSRGLPYNADSSHQARSIAMFQVTGIFHIMLTAHIKPYQQQCAKEVAKFCQRMLKAKIKPHQQQCADATQEHANMASAV